MDCQNIVNNKNHKTSRMPRQQRGIAMVLLTVGMLIVLVIAGLALDISHALLNKTRLQTIVDMSALAAAQTLDQTGDIDLATATARQVANGNMDLPGNVQINQDVGDADIIVEFSADLEPFEAGAVADAAYVRVRIETVSLASWLVQIIGIDAKPVRASAVSGPSAPLGSVCGIVPLIVCGNPGEANYGFEDEEVTVLKSGSQTDYDSGAIGPGNFQLASYGGSSSQGASGAAVVEKNLQQGIPNCEGIGNTIDTQPGNQIGPVADGLNNRFNCYGPNCSWSNNESKKYDKDGLPVKSDTVIAESTYELSLSDDGTTILYNDLPLSTTNEPDFRYNDYKNVAPANYDLPMSEFATPGRRVLPVVVADCSATSNTGQSTLNVLDVGCFFMLQKINSGEAGGGNEGEVYGEFIESCRSKGGLGSNQVDGPYKIVLYNDWNSKDS